MSTKVRHRVTILAASALAALSCLVGGAAAVSAVKSANAPTPHKGGTLKVGTPYDVLSFDPYARNAQNNLMTRVIYEPLIDLNVSLQPKPMLATAWSFSQDLTGVTLTLRQGVTFHSGTPFNAAAVIANFQRARNPATGQNMFALTAPVKDVSSPSPSGYTVRIDFNGPTPKPLAFDVLYSLPMVDPSYFTKLQNQASGTGPFSLKQWTPGQSIQLQANRSWWGGKTTGAPYLDEVDITPFTDPSAAVAALQSNSVDLIADFDPQRAADLKKAGFTVVAGAPGSFTQEVRLNTQQPPFNNTTYRRLMNYAVDRQAILNASRGGFGSPAVTPWFTQAPAREAQLLKVYKYNPAKVANVVKQMTSNGFKPDFTLMIATTQPDNIIAGQIIQAAFKTAGVNVAIQQVDGATYIANVLAGNFQAAMAYGAGGQHYPSLITLNSTWRTSNSPLWGNNVPKAYVDAIAADQTALTAAAQQKALARLYGAALVMSSDITIGDRPPVYAYSKNVHGFVTTLDSMPDYGSAWLG